MKKKRRKWRGYELGEVETARKELEKEEKEKTKLNP